jgi:hypothetical protein
MYRRMRKALIREIAPVTVLDWIEAEEYSMARARAMARRRAARQVHSARAQRRTG